MLSITQEYVESRAAAPAENHIIWLHSWGHTNKTEQQNKLPGCYRMDAEIFADSLLVTQDLQKDQMIICIEPDFQFASH